ncbi:MAG: DNA-directed RNA polymerase subunit N [Candidatus Micrarchaeota archaeon]|nr:DNA-directed RNA polymerase subunit N [Candidatus Micrarchaeota archaeon]
MYFPVRCFSCGAVIGHLYEKYAEKIKSGANPAKVLDELEVERYCCRRMFLSHVDAMEKIIRYKRY